MRRLPLPPRALAALLLLGSLLMLGARTAGAQIGSSTDILTGRITGADSQAVAGALVSAQSVETQVTRTTRTNDAGRYTIVFPDGGGQYRLTITSIGYAPARLTVARQADEDRLVADVRVGRAAVQLGTVTVQARANQGRPQRDAGSTEQNLPKGLLDRLPIDQSDLNAVAALAPGVVAIPGTDTTAAGFSIAGQPGSQNNITLDGLTFGAGSVPQDAVRATRVITSTYDVARGQFSGGLVAATTRSGTNVANGTASLLLRDPSLAASAGPGTVSQTYEQQQVSAGYGGALKKDKLFAFGAFQASRRRDPLTSLLGGDPALRARLGVSQDSVARFLSLVSAAGVPVTAGDVPGERPTDNGSALLRLDYNIAEQHTLTLRGDWRGSTQGAARVSPLGLPQAGGEGGNSAGGAQLTLTSRVSSFINELRAYESGESRHTDPYLDLPAARVLVASELEDGTRSLSSLQFGGNAGLPQTSRTTSFEGTDELSWVSPGGAHRIKLGTLLSTDRARTVASANRLGTFTFNSLGDLASGQAAQFTRTLGSRTRTSGSETGALWLGDAWRVSRALQLTYGARLEGSRYPDAPALNALVDSVFGRRTSDFPTEARVSPRAGFTYTAGADGFGPPRLTIRGGAGEFRGRAPSQLFGLAADATGLPGSQTQLVCVGSAVPVPAFASYMNDPSSVPSTCADGGSGLPAFVATRGVTVFDPSFEAPRTRRASLGASTRLLDRYQLGVDASYTRGQAQTGSTDLNLVASPAFTLANEGGRPVFASATSIVPATGAVALAGSRRDPRFGTVTEISSGLLSDTRQVTFTGGGFALFRALVNGSYTYTRSRDEARGLSAGFQGGASGGDPRLAEWARSDQDRRHAIQATVTYPVTSAVELSLIGRFISGAPYTPTVDGDVNGDGQRNDRAFVFDPAAATARGDTALAAGMTRLLAGAPSSARDCLERQLGNIAGRNTCSSPWQQALDMQLNLRPSAWGLDRRLTISVQALNTLAGVDQLLHGENDLRGWGQNGIPDRTLLQVRGFDPATGSFRYVVNERFGATSGTRAAFRSPFQLALQGRLTIGQDPQRQGMRGVFGGGGANGRPPTAADFRQRLARAVPNTFRQILDSADALGLALTPEQTRRLTAHGDTLQGKADTLVNALATVLANQGNNPDPLVVMGRLRGRVAEGRALAQQSVKTAQEILTPEQWAKLPARIKDPLQGRGGGPGGPGGDDGPRPGGPPRGEGGGPPGE